MPIADIELVIMASATVCLVQHFPCEVDDWEGPPLHRTHLVGVEDGLPSHAPQTPVSDLGLGGGGGTTQWGSRRAPCSGSGDWTVGDGTRQPCTCSNERHCHPPAAHIGQSGTNGYHRHAHRNQHEIGGGSGMRQGASNGDADGRGEIYETSAPWKLLLDAWPLH